MKHYKSLLFIVDFRMNLFRGNLSSSQSMRGKMIVVKERGVVVRFGGGKASQRLQGQIDACAMRTGASAFRSSDDAHALAERLPRKYGPPTRTTNGCEGSWFFDRFFERHWCLRAERFGENSGCDEMTERTAGCSQSFPLR